MAQKAPFRRSVLLTGVLIATVVAVLPAACEPMPDLRGSGDGFIHVPGMPPIAIPPRVRDAEGSSLDRPGTSAKRDRPSTQKPLTPAEKADAIRKALAPRPPTLVTRRKILDELYDKLAAARDEAEAKGLAGLIGDIWVRSESDTANLLMQRALTSIQAKNYQLALKILDRLVLIQPNWPEAWNKRASVRFFEGDLDGSMVDVDHVLRLEPRHFGALDGLASILHRTGFDKRALDIYRRALAVYPHQTNVEKIVEKLTLEVEGQGI